MQVNKCKILPLNFLLFSDYFPAKYFIISNWAKKLFTNYCGCSLQPVQSLPLKASFPTILKYKDHLNKSPKATWIWRVKKQAQWQKNNNKKEHKVQITDTNPLTCPLLSVLPSFLFFVVVEKVLLSLFLLPGVSGLTIAASLPAVAAWTLAIKDFCLATKSGLSRLRVDRVLVGVLEADREARWLDRSEREGVSEPASEAASRSLPVWDSRSLRSSSDTVSWLEGVESSSRAAFSSDIFLHLKGCLPALSGRGSEPITDFKHINIKSESHSEPISDFKTHEYIKFPLKHV